MVLVNFISLTAMTEWAERLLWYDDDRFAKHPYFKFAVHSVCRGKEHLHNQTYTWRQSFYSNLKKKLVDNGDKSVRQKCSILGGT